MMCIGLALVCLLDVAVHASDRISDVRRQYETFPYPELGRPPERISDAEWVKKEAGRLLMANHFVYDGELLRRHGHRTSQPLRVLIAGGGTGRDTVLIAKEMEDSNIVGTIVHLDISQAAIKKAQEWVNAAGLQGRVSYELDSIESFTMHHEANSLPFFDFIWCSGVLHHLLDPLAGLKGLRQILAPDGGMFVMMYGRHGRTGVYDAQAALRYALPANERLSDKERVVELKGFLFGDGAIESQSKSHGISGLADTNILALNREVAPKPHEDDASLYDNLLHSQDHAYSVLDFHQLLDSAGLRLVSLIPEASYEPDFTVFQTPVAQRSYMAERIRNRTRLEQFHFSELMTSRPISHAAFVIHAKNYTARPGSSDYAGSPQSCEIRAESQASVSWIHRKTPVVLHPDETQFLPEAIPNLRRLAVFRESAEIFMDLDRRAGKAMARLPLPTLSFAFLEQSLSGSITADEILRRVHASAHEWAKEFNSSEAPLEPLSYGEVEKQFFDWVHKMEATVKVLWVRA